MRQRELDKLKKKRQERMRLIVANLQAYMANYDKQPNYLDYEDDTIIDDVIYGLGTALQPEEYRWGNGYDKFKRLLIERWTPALKRSSRRNGEASQERK